MTTESTTGTEQDRVGERGASEMEYILVLAMFVAPMTVGIWIAEWFITYYYRHLSFTVLLPFP